MESCGRTRRSPVTQAVGWRCGGGASVSAAQPGLRRHHEPPAAMDNDQEDSAKIPTGRMRPVAQGRHRSSWADRPEVRGQVVDDARQILVRPFRAPDDHVVDQLPPAFAGSTWSLGHIFGHVASRADSLDHFLARSIRQVGWLGQRCGSGQWSGAQQEYAGRPEATTPSRSRHAASGRYGHGALPPHRSRTNVWTRPAIPSVPSGAPDNTVTYCRPSSS
jgi:hypothetical protein